VVKLQIAVAGRAERRSVDRVMTVNLQRDGNSAKVYQVRQVRLILLKYRLTAPDRREEK